MLIFLLISGVALDRLPRMRVMVAADLASRAAVRVVAALAEAQRPEGYIFVASMIFGFLQAFFPEDHS